MKGHHVIEPDPYSPTLFHKQREQDNDFDKIQL